MTSRVQAARWAVRAHAETSEAAAVIERYKSRARAFRLALGGVGLFWVCALLVLMR